MTKNIRKVKKVYQHLSSEERDLISGYLSEGKNKTEIAKILDRSPSTISREINRNSLHKYTNIYYPITAHKTAEKRKLKSRQKERIKNPKVREIISAKIRIGWTPEQIAGHINKNYPFKANYESIYLYLYNDADELVKYLARARAKRQKRLQKQGKRMLKIPNRTMINERPGIINERRRFGDWEADTVVSRQSKTTLVVLRERKLQKILIKKIPSRTADNFNKAIIGMFKNIPIKLRKSITFDNGLENARHEVLQTKLGVKTFFCNPYHSWEKGSVENSIGLIRRFLPKKTDFSLIPESEIRYIENLLNERPRKSLNFNSPNQVFLNCTS